MFNGIPNSPLEEEANRRENAWMNGQERDIEESGEKGPEFPCPAEIWTGHYAEIADIVGVRDWRVWLGITAALSARAHRNVHASYYSDLYGMGYWLLVSGSATGKSLLTRLCSSLLPHEYRCKYSVESGQGLVNLLANPVKGEDGKVVSYQSVPTMLLLSEWTTLLSNMAIRGSSLMEKLNETYDAEHAVEVNRTDKQGVSDSVSVRDPMLTMLGATTLRGFRKRVQDHHRESGFLNRHFILPGPSTHWRYASGQEYFPAQELRAYADQHLPRGGAFGLGQPMRALYEPVAFSLDAQWGRALLEPLHNGHDEDTDLAAYLRLHAYARRIPALIAWSEGDTLIRRVHLAAAHAAVECSLAYLQWLLADAPIELAQWQRAQGEVEEKIIRKINEKPGVRKDEVCKALRKNGGYPAIADMVDKLVKSGAILLRTDGQKKCLYLPP